MNFDGLTFDDEYKVHILPVTQRDETEKIVKAATEYQQALYKFDETSTKVIAYIDKLAQATEARRGYAMSLKALNQGQELYKEYNMAMGRAKLSCRSFELECAKFEVTAFEQFLISQKKTKTAVVEIFGTE